MDLKRKHGWKGDNTAMRYIKDTKIHARQMAQKVAGSSGAPNPNSQSASTSAGSDPCGTPSVALGSSATIRKPRLMPLPIPKNDSSVFDTSASTSAAFDSPGPQNAGKSGLSLTTPQDNSVVVQNTSGVKLLDSGIEIKDEKTGHTTYINLAGAQNISLTIN